MAEQQFLNRPLGLPMLVLAVALMAAAVLPHAWNVPPQMLLFFLATAGLRFRCRVQYDSSNADAGWMTAPRRVVASPCPTGPSTSTA